MAVAVFCGDQERGRKMKIRRATLLNDFGKEWQPDKKLRYDIRKAQASCQLKELAPDDIKIAYRLYSSMCYDYYLRPKPFEDFQKREFIGVYHKNNLIAFASFWTKDSWLMLTNNATLPEYRNLQPNCLLYNQLINTAKTRGLKGIDWGGIDPDTKDIHKLSINSYKKKWSNSEKEWFESVSFFQWVRHKLRDIKLLRNPLTRKLFFKKPEEMK